MEHILDLTGLGYFWEKMKAIFAKKSDIPAASTTAPVMDGVATIGSSTAYARADHKHPSDTTKAEKIAEINHGTSDTTFAITPNIFHKWGTINSLTLSYGTSSGSDVKGYWFKFTAGSSFSALTLPTGVVWAAEPVIESGKTYEVMIVDGLATYLTENIKEDFATNVKIVSTNNSSLYASVNVIYTYENNVTQLSIVLPSITKTGISYSIAFVLTTGSSPTISFSSVNNIPIFYHNGYNIKENTMYEINAMYIGTAWIIGACEVLTT